MYKMYGQKVNLKQLNEIKFQKKKNYFSKEKREKLLDY